VTAKPWRTFAHSADQANRVMQPPRSHMTMSGGSDKSIDGYGDSSDHRRQQRDWPWDREL